MGHAAKLPVLLTLVAILPACLAPTVTPGTPAGVYDAIEAAIGAPIVAEHDHADPALHASAHNLVRIALVHGHEPNAPPANEAYAETAVRGDSAYLTRYGDESGLAIFDIRDLANPKLVGSLRIDAGFEPDIEVSSDGNWAFWETQRAARSRFAPTLTDPGANAPHGVHIIDVSDKTNPRWAGFHPVDPDGPHSITYANIGGRHIVFHSVYAYAYAYYNVEVPGAQRLIITELDTTGPQATLRELAVYREDSPRDDPGGHYMPHDVSVSTHPVTGQTLAYVAYWDHGVVTLDVTDPANPRKVSRYTDFGPAEYRNVHMVRQFPHLIDGKVVLVVEPEIGGSRDTGYLTFIDATDPANPRYISSWLLPGNLTSQGDLFSPHYFDLAQGRVAMASYHAGVWVIDVHNRENLLNPRTVAYAQLRPERALLSGGLPNAPPLSTEGSAFDAWWHNGHVIVGDALNGLAIYRYDGPDDAPR